MNDKLKTLHNKVLIEKLESLVRLERRTTADIICLIKEVDVRRLYLDLGYTSLFSYLTKDLGYTFASAQRRIDSARLLKSHPELKAEIECGSLNLTQISILSQGLRQRQKEQPKTKINIQDKTQILKKIKNCDLLETQKLVAQSLDLTLQTQQKIRIQRDESIRLEITLSKQEMANLIRIKELISHTDPNPQWSEVISKLANYYIQQKDPLVKATSKKSKSLLKLPLKDSNFLAPTNNEFKNDNTEKTSQLESKLNGSKTGKTSYLKFKYKNSKAEMASSLKSKLKNCNIANTNQITSESEVVASQDCVKVRSDSAARFVSAKTKYEVFRRDRTCQWISKRTGNICDSKFQLQLDHKKPVWAGGVSECNNLQLLCSQHNQLKYRSESGLKLK